MHAEFINVLVNPRWRPAAISYFQNFAFPMKFSNFCYAKVYAVQISAKKLNPCGSYYHFGKSKMATAAFLDFQNFAFLMKFSNFVYAKVYAVQISAKKLIPSGSY